MDSQKQRGNRTIPISSRSSVTSSSSLPVIPTTRVPRLSGKSRLYRTRRNKRDLSLDDTHASDAGDSSLHLPEIHHPTNKFDDITTDTTTENSETKALYSKRKGGKKEVARGISSGKRNVSSGLKTNRTERIVRVKDRQQVNTSVSSKGHKTERPDNWKERSRDKLTSPHDTEGDVAIGHRREKDADLGTEGVSSRGEDGAVKNDVLTCLTCGDASKYLKLLPCLHVFCQTCIEININEFPSGRWFKCDLCQEHVQVPEGGIARLEDVSFLYESSEAGVDFKCCESCKDEAPSCVCASCKHSLCNNCAKVHIIIDQNTEHNIIEFHSDHEIGSSYFPSNVCTEHPPFTLELFCVTCSIPICGRCAIGKHTSHIAESLQVTADDKRRELTNHLSDSSATRAQRGLRDNVRACRKEKRIIQEDAKRTVIDIQSHIQDLKNELDELGRKMITDVLEKESAVVAHLGASLDETERQQKSLGASTGVLNHIIARTDDVSIVRRSNKLRASIIEVKNSSKPSPVQCVRLKYKPLLQSVKMSMGRLNTDTFLKREINYVLTCSLQLKTGPVTTIYAIDSLRAWVGFRKYMQLCSKDGTLGAIINMEEQVIAIDADSNHRMFVACKESIKTVGPSLEPKFLFHLPHEPSDVKINERNELIISFKDAKRVALYSSKGKPLKELDVKNLGFRFGARINDPWKLGINGNQVVFVTDYMCDTIALYDRHGELKSAIACNVYRYASICCNRGLLLVADYKRDCIQVLSEEGKLLQTCQMEGLCSPYCIAVDSSGDLWLGTWTGQIKVFTTKY